MFIKKGRVDDIHYKLSSHSCFLMWEALIQFCLVRRMDQETHLLTAVLSESNATDDLVVDEVGADRILPGAVPGGEDLLAEVEAPGRVALVRAALLHQLLALGDGVQNMVSAPAQRPHLPHRDTAFTAMPALGLPQGQETQSSWSPDSKKNPRKVSR